MRIAIVGGGQLARMMALDGIPMGLQFSFLVEPGEDTRCVDGLGNIAVLQADDTPEKIFENLGKPDVITVEKEHVNVELLEAMCEHCPVHPNPHALSKFKNRRDEKLFLQSLNIPIAPFYNIESRDDLLKAADQLSKPIFLKTQEEGYDGYNQFKITEDNLEEIIPQLSFPGKWVAEGFIAFEREISFLAARNSKGEITYYPAVENAHHNGTLITSLAPAPDISDEQTKIGQKYISDILNTLDYVGLICMECFVDNGKILVNEIAPRVHNSGHWTSKGALTSQFENHVRAVAGLPLGATTINSISGILNLLGVELNAAQACSESAFLTLYGKTVRARRKLGHVTVTGDSHEDVMARILALKTLAYGELS